MFLYGETIILNGYKLKNNGSWLSMLLCTGICFIIYGIYALIMSRNPGKDIFEIFVDIFGKIFGRLFIFIFIVFCMFVGIEAIKNITIFIITLTFPETPVMYIAFVLLIVIYIIVRCGIEVLGRASCVIFPLIALTVVLFLTLLIDKIDIRNIKPLVAEPFKNIAKGGIFNFLIIFGDGVIFLGIITSSESKSNHLKSYYMANIISGFLFILSILGNIAVLGLPLVNYIYFQTFMAISVIDIAQFLTRMEVILSLVILLCVLFRAIICIYVASKGAQKLFAKKDYKKFILPFCLIAFFFAVETLQNIEEVDRFRIKYSWIKSIVQVGIPLILAIIIVIKGSKPQPAEEPKKVLPLKMFKKIVFKRIAN
jgi:spore germination protein KB